MHLRVKNAVMGSRAVAYALVYSPTSIYSVSYSAARQASSGLFALTAACARAAATNRWMRLKYLLPRGCFMQQAHSVQAAIPVTRTVLVVVAHVHLADVETMTR